MRNPLFDGQFYEKNFQDLDKQINDCFIDKLGPGDLPTSRTSKVLNGIIAPHAGYIFSGPCQAWAYKEIAESKFPKVFVILGTNHSGLGARFSTMLTDWLTPFGVVKVDIDYGRDLMEKFNLLKNDSTDHLREHSIEVQLPFLQFVNKDKLKDIRFLPILVGDGNFEDLQNLGRAIADMDKKAEIIASSDFTHFGYNYRYTPFAFSKKKSVEELDRQAIDLILGMESKEFFDLVIKKRMTICGFKPIIVLLEALKDMGVKKGKLLHYYTSAEVSKDEDNMVGYAAIKF